MYFLPEKIGL